MKPLERVGANGSGTDDLFGAQGEAAEGHNLLEDEQNKVNMSSSTHGEKRSHPLSDNIGIGLSLLEKHDGLAAEKTLWMGLRTLGDQPRIPRVGEALR